MADRVQWGGTRRKVFTEWMQTEVLRVLAQRDPLARKWRTWLQQRFLAGICTPFGSAALIFRPWFGLDWLHWLSTFLRR